VIRRLLIAAALLAAQVAPAAAGGGDAHRGEEVYQRCAACHSLERNRSGPKHCGVYGRPAAGVAGYPYSKALKGSGLVWDDASLDKFLENPMKTVPGTRMGYAGVKDPADREDLIAYLREASQDPAKCS
jgi:cytochrome c